MAIDDQRIKIIFDNNAAQAAKDSNTLATSLDKVDQSAEDAGKSMQSLTNEIQEQKDITIEFQKELAILEKRLKETPKNALAEQKLLKTEIVGLKDAIKDQGIAVKDLSNQRIKAIAVEKEAEKAAKETANTMKGLNATFEQVYGELQPLTTRLGEAEDRLYELALAGKTNTKEFTDLLAVVSNYRKVQIETDKVVDASATTLGQKLGGAAQIAATGVQGVTAGMALFGDQSEDTEKALLKVQAAMAFADAISSISTLGGQFTVLKTTVLESSIITKANSAAIGAAAIVQKLFTGSVDTTSKGFKGLKTAIAGTGIGLLVVGVIALIQNFDTVKKVVFDLVPGLQGVGETIGNIVNAVTDFIGVTSEADRAIERIKSNADQSISLNKKFLAEHGSQLNEFTKQKISAKDKYNEAVKEDGADITALGRELNRELAAIEYSRGDEQRAIQKTNAEKAAADAITNGEKAKKAAAKAVQDAIDKREEVRAAAEKKAIEDAQEEQNIFGELTGIQDEKQKEKEGKTLQQGTDNLAQLQFFADEESRIDKNKADQKKAIEDSALNAAGSAVSFLSQIAGKNKVLQKAAILAESALGIGKSIIANNTANVAALATPQAIATSGVAAQPVIAFNNISTALGIAGNIAATAKALQSLGGGGAPSGGGGAAAGGGAPPAVAFNNTSENQIGQSVARTQADQPPLQVFVSEKDISDAQRDVKVLVAKNTF